VGNTQPRETSPLDEAHRSVTPEDLAGPAIAVAERD
jgi:hypothetical protein